MLLKHRSHSTRSIIRNSDSLTWYISTLAPSPCLPSAYSVSPSQHGSTAPTLELQASILLAHWYAETAASLPYHKSYNTLTLISFRSTVLPRLLLLHRRECLLQIPLQRLRRPHHLRGLDSFNLLRAGHAGDQQHREIPPLRRQLLV